MLIVAVIARVLLLPLLPSLSDDGFRFIWDGMLPWQGFSPYSHAPTDHELTPLADHPAFTRMNSHDYFTVYPPVSQFLFMLWGWIPAGFWPFTFVAMKLTVVAIEFTGLLVLAKMVKPTLLILYAWNPIVVVETAGQLHTEPVMAALIVGAIYWHKTNKPGLAVSALSAAMWVKLYPVFMLPFLLRRVGWKWMTAAVILSGILLLPFAEPAVLPRVLESLSLYVNYFEFYSGPYLILKATAYKLGLFSDVEQTVGLVLMTGFLGFVVWLYLSDHKRRDLETEIAFVFAAWFVCSTTIHPWYFVGLLAVLPVAGIPRAPWLWLAGLSAGTYLLYTNDTYWMFVWLGWGGWLLLVLLTSTTIQDAYRGLLAHVLRMRGRQKAALVSPHLEDGLTELARPLSILDLGAGEGFVGEALHVDGRRTVTLCDTRGSNETELPFVRYDGLELPFGDKWFDTTVILYTLHHCRDHVAVLREAARVTDSRVVILESVFSSEAHRRFFTLLDRLANVIRSGGEMHADTHFRKTNDWIELLETMQFKVQSVRTWGRIHKQALIVVDAPPVAKLNSPARST